MGSSRTRVLDGDGASEQTSGKGVFLALLIFIPLLVLLALYYLHGRAEQVAQFEERGQVTIVTLQTDGTVITTTTFLTPSLELGAFDPGLGRMGSFAVGPIIALLGGIIETSLLLVFGAFYVNKAENKENSLGLPPNTVRVFVLIIVVLTIMVFALLPSAWGDNKAVVFLFGLLSTVVGFYFGSSKDENRPDTPATPSVKVSTPEGTIVAGAPASSTIGSSSEPIGTTDAGEAGGPQTSPPTPPAPPAPPMTPDSGSG